MNKTITKNKVNKNMYIVDIEKIKELEVVRLLEDTYNLESPIDEYLSIKADKLG